MCSPAPDHNDELSSLFAREPDQSYLRGDPFLWRDMKQAVSTLALPNTEAEFVALFESIFETLTDGKLPQTVSSESDSIYVERYSLGGMSSGQVSLRFWDRAGACPLSSLADQIPRNHCRHFLAATVHPTCKILVGYHAPPLGPGSAHFDKGGNINLWLHKR
jgi:hypothetical protein